MIVIRPKPCAVCGAIFQPTGNKGQCCSPKCTLQHLSKQHGDCRVWTGSKNKKGYGDLRVKGVGVRAHRLSWEIANNAKIPDGMFILHSCDNPSCIEPKHLRVGTAAENTADMLSKGRAKTGDQCSWTKIPDSEIPLIRERIANGPRGTASAIALEYGVHHQTISDIRNKVKRKGAAEAAPNP